MEGLNPLFKMIHDYVNVHLPEERKLSAHTVRSYKKALELLVDFVKGERGIPLSGVTFDMIDRTTLSAFLDHLERDRGCSVATRNQRLKCIRSFYSYAAREDVALVCHLDEVSKVRPASSGTCARAPSSRCSTSPTLPPTSACATRRSCCSSTRPARASKSSST